MPLVFKDYGQVVIICLLSMLPIALRAGGTPEEVKAFQENKARAEAVVGFGGYPDQSQAG